MQAALDVKPVEKFKDYDKEILNELKSNVSIAYHCIYFDASLFYKYSHLRNHRCVELIIHNVKNQVWFKKFPCFKPKTLEFT